MGLLNARFEGCGPAPPTTIGQSCAAQMSSRCIVPVSESAFFPNTVLQVYAVAVLNDYYYQLKADHAI